ncbi:class I adenylate-forming enzyme family protein [Ramlibacter sp.]|uniref:class I adenylate-forming enzyme family protein n=1 Tax=Ramlibacter sp. TaxID=1917967 RepID=UPI002C8F013E|nr:class I adenylate-forming enzyme family protein [Ramlibacter sp.]HWI82138.1 class I adenylate-forming enzyme family protein [Ramlibacter sp.]
MNAVPWSAQLRGLAARFGAAPAVTAQHGGTLSYAALADRAHALAEMLAARGVAAGQPVAILLPNCAEAVWCAYGVRLAGAADTPLGWGATDQEVAWAARLAGFATVITTADRAAAMRALGLQALLPGSVPAQPAARAAWAAAPAEATGRLLFTSGTTGKPKGVRYSHGRRWIAEQLLRATLPFTPARGSRLLLVTPFAHGASLLTFAWCEYGGEVLLEGGVDPARVRTLLRRGGVEALFAPPTVIAKLAAALEGERFEGLRCVFTGTQPLPAALYAKACAMFGPVVRVTYGKTECFNPIAVLEAADTNDWFAQQPLPPGACVGWPAPGVAIEIRDGQVWLRAQHLCDELLGPDGPIPHEAGWHATGDLGCFDERGRLVLLGRVADVIKTGGYRVNPDEIESLLAGLPGAGAMCVAGLPSDYWGEIILAVAEAAPPGWAEAVRARVAVLSRHKQPRLFATLAALPRNAQGKISRREVVRQVLASYRLTDGAHPVLLPAREEEPPWTTSDSAAPA